MTLTFIHLANAPKLASAERKRVRGHVTRGNYVRRKKRPRKNGTEQQHPCEHLEIEHDTHKARHAPKESSENSNESISARLELPSTTTTCLDQPLIDHDIELRFLMREFQPLLFPNSLQGDSLKHAISWLDLVQAEPALLHATMAITMRHWPIAKPFKAARTWRSYMSSAVRGVNKRLDQSPINVTDGLMSAVFTLSYSEDLLRNNVAREAHINGLKAMMALRRKQNHLGIPSWFTVLVLHDSMSNAISAPFSALPSIVDAIDDHRSREYIETMRSISIQLTHLTQCLDNSIKQSLDATSKTQLIFKITNDLINLIGNLPVADVAFPITLTLALNIYLFMLWPPSRDNISISLTIEKLKKHLGEPTLRMCSSVRLTAWQYLVGAVASEQGTDTFRWFARRLKRLLTFMQIRDWESVLELLHDTFFPSKDVLKKTKEIWESLKTTVPDDFYRVRHDVHDATLRP